MIRLLYHNNISTELAEGLEALDLIDRDKLIWVDMEFPTEGEKRKVENLFNLPYGGREIKAATAGSPRFYEGESYIYISSFFIRKLDDHYEDTPVAFYLLDRVLITERNAHVLSLEEVLKRIQRNPRSFLDGAGVLEGILETKIDMDADFIEMITQEISTAVRDLSPNFTNEQEPLLKIKEYQGITTLLRGNFINKQRVVSSLLKTDTFRENARLKILLNDIDNMLEYLSFSFGRLEFLQNTLLALINVQQSKTIKTFTIITIVFMPPTLIASIYGMNFRFMPELGWPWGYPFALLLIVGSSFLTWYYFKRRKWSL